MSHDELVQKISELSETTKGDGYDGAADVLAQLYICMQNAQAEKVFMSRVRTIYHQLIDSTNGNFGKFCSPETVGDASDKLVMAMLN